MQDYELDWAHDSTGFGESGIDVSDVTAEEAYQNAERWRKLVDDRSSATQEENELLHDVVQWMGGHDYFHAANTLAQEWLMAADFKHDWAENEKRAAEVAPAKATPREPWKPRRPVLPPPAIPELACIGGTSTTRRRFKGIAHVLKKPRRRVKGLWLGTIKPDDLELIEIHNAAVAARELTGSSE